MLNYSTEIYIRNYIHTSLIPRLAMLDRTMTDDVNECARLRKELSEYCNGGYAHLLHEEMKPFYEKYIHLDSDFFAQSHTHVCSLVKHVMKEDPYFGRWFQECNLLQIVEEWESAIANDGISQIVFHIMHCALTGEYENDWKTLADDFRIRLLSTSEYGTVWSREIYAILHGVCMIWQTPLHENEKMQMLEIMHREWGFLKYLYSVMFRCVIGCKYKNIFQIANMIHCHADYHPYAHLFYAPFAERVDEYCKRKGDEKKAAGHLLKIEEVMESTPTSNDLDDLCNLLFPKELCVYLDKHRPKNIHQLKEEMTELRKQLAETTRQMNLQVQEMAHRIAALLNASVPIEEITQELLLLEYKEAMEVYNHLNSLLVNNKAWQNNTAKIRSQIYALRNPIPAVQATNYYAPGSTHEDRSHHLNVEGIQPTVNKQIGQA